MAMCALDPIGTASASVCDSRIFVQGSVSTIAPASTSPSRTIGKMQSISLTMRNSTTTVTTPRRPNGKTLLA